MLSVIGLPEQMPNLSPGQALPVLSVQQLELAVGAPASRNLIMEDYNSVRACINVSGCTANTSPHLESHQQHDRNLPVDLDGYCTYLARRVLPGWVAQVWLHHEMHEYTRDRHAWQQVLWQCMLQPGNRCPELFCTDAMHGHGVWQREAQSAYTHQATVHSNDTLQPGSCFASNSRSTARVRFPCLLLLAHDHVYVTCPAARTCDAFFPQHMCTSTPIQHHLIDCLKTPWSLFKLPATYDTLFGMWLLRSHLCRSDLAGQNHSEPRLAVHHQAQNLGQLIVQLTDDGACCLVDRVSEV